RSSPDRSNRSRWKPPVRYSPGEVGRSVGMSARVQSGWVVAVALGLVLLAPAGARAHAPSPTTYVALGDSYTAGPLIPIQEQPYGCLRSTNNYPKVAARDLGLTVRD